MALLLYAIIVVLNLPTTVNGLIAFAQLIVQKMTGNTYFPTATATLTAAQSAITAYQSTVSSSAKGQKGLRLARKNALVTLLKQLRDIVRVVAEADPDNAAAIAESAGMRLKSLAARIKALISVVQGAVSGSVVCRAKSVGNRANYYWFYSVDQKSWVSVPESMKTTVTITGLTAGQTYYFRYHTMTRKVTSDFSQVFTLMVK